MNPPDPQPSPDSPPSPPSYPPSPAPSAPPEFSHYPGIPAPIRVALTVVDPVPCSYLPGRTSVSRGLWASRIDDAAMEAFLDAGFRRSGHILYQPVCPGCRACVPLRIDVAAFTPSPSQRRSSRRNADLEVSVAAPVLSGEKLALYDLYLRLQHDRAESPEKVDLESFLYSSPATTIEIEYRLPNRELIGVGICDITPSVLSSVYFYWHPDHHRRSLGVFSTLRELDLARRLGCEWYHMGYWVAHSKTMDYKSRVGVHQLLHPDGGWRVAVSKPKD